MGPCVVWALKVSLLFLAKLAKDLKNNERVGPTRLEKQFGKGGERPFGQEPPRISRKRNTRPLRGGHAKEVLGMAKVLPAKEATAQWCQIREGGPKAETAKLCQKEGSTARECQTAGRASFSETAIWADKERRGVSAKESTGAEESSREDAQENYRSNFANGGCSQRCENVNGHSDGRPNHRADPGRPSCTSAVGQRSVKKALCGEWASCRWGPT
jgi:hypothetical protein